MKVERASVCPLDCPDTCSLTVTVDDDRIVGIRGSRRQPVHGRRALRQGPAAIARVRARRRGACARRCAGSVRRARGGSSPSRGSRRSTRPRALHARSSPRTARRRSCPSTTRARTACWPDGSMDCASSTSSAPPCSTAAAVRRHPERGLGGHLRRRARASAGAGRARQAHRGLGQQRRLVANLHFVPLINRARQAQGRQARGGRPHAHQDRRAGRSAPGAAPGTDVVLGWALADRARAAGAHRPRVHRAPCRGFETYMARGARWPARARPRLCGVPESQIARFAEWTGERTGW